MHFSFDIEKTLSDLLLTEINVDKIEDNVDRKLAPVYYIRFSVCLRKITFCKTGLVVSRVSIESFCLVGFYQNDTIMYHTQSSQYLVGFSYEKPAGLRYRQYLYNMCIGCK
jgi:hypothetical protein